MKKGISLATLSIVVLLMIILATTITTTGVFALNNSKKIKFASEIALVQEMVDEYEDKKADEYPIGSSIIVDLSNVSTNAITDFDDEIKNKSEITLYEIDFSLLGKSDLIYGNKKNADETDIYAVSKQTGKVYYIKGVKIGKNVYYTLNEELKSSINYSSSVNAVTKDGIIFNTSKSKWTNKNIDSNVKVPDSSEYKNVTVSVIQGSNVRNIEVSDSKKGYNIYNISNVNGNYEVTVNYNKNSNANIQNFSVSNFDNEPPKFTISKTQTLINESDNVKQTYVKVDVEHDVSGIKYTKYETDNIDLNIAKQYFSSNGIEFKDGAFTVDRFTKDVTVYVEDKAGNYSIQTITLESAASYSDYVKDGIAISLDGKNNTVNGHSNESTIWQDLSVNKFKCSLNGVATWRDNSLYFDGVDDYVEISQINYPYASFECVFTSEDKLTGTPCIFGNWQSGGGGIYIDNGYIYASLYINSNYQEIKIDSPIEIGKKYSVSLTFDGRVMKAYVNGKFEKSIDIDGKIENPQDSVAMSVGANINRIGVSDYFKGLVYNARYYSRALNEKEVKQNFKIDKIRFGI